MSDMPSADNVWGAQLLSEGFTHHILPNTCPFCYTVRDFCDEHKQGTYVLGTGTHAVAVIDGDYYDSWDSGDKIPLFYWRKENNYAVLYQLSTELQSVCSTATTEFQSEFSTAYK